MDVAFISTIERGCFLLRSFRVSKPLFEIAHYINHLG